MNQEDREALKEFLSGSGFVFGFVVVVCIVVFFLIVSTSQPTEHKQETEVVGQYKECDIVRWSYAPLAEYKYFLHCP